MRICGWGVALTGVLGLSGMLMTVAGAAEDPKSGETSAAVVLKEDCYRAANFVVG